MTSATMNFDLYAARFEAAVYTLLGGLEMADEYFLLHPLDRYSMQTATMYHYNKGGSYWKGSYIWFTRIAKPRIAKDRKLARTIDPRD